MIVVPTDGRIWLYGPELDDVESEPVFEEDHAQLPALRDYMLDLMNKYNGVGIAAPQVGVFKQFILVRMSDGDVVELINQEIREMYGKEIMGYEGCLSVPPSGNGCLVPRMERITVECSTTQQPKVISTIALGRRAAVVVQHEIDHLEGILYVDKAAKIYDESEQPKE